MRRLAILTLLPVSLALAGCGEGRAPSEQLRDATEKLVEEAAGQPAPSLGQQQAAPCTLR